MEPTPELIEALRRDKVEAAKRMSPESKLAAGAELFDMACELARSGIRMQHPDADDAQVDELLRQRLQILHKRSGIYGHA